MFIRSVVLVTALLFVGCVELEYDCEYLSAQIEAHEWCIAEETCRTTKDERFYYIKYKTRWLEYRCETRLSKSELND